VAMLERGSTGLAGDRVADQWRGPDLGAFGVDGGLQDRGVGGEVLQEVEAGAKAEDGDALAGRQGLEVFDHLLADAHLVDRRSVQGVEEQDVEGAVDRAAGMLV